MPASASLRVSEQEYLAIGETRERMELVDGEIYVPPAPTRSHQHVTGTIYALLRAWADVQLEPYFVGLAPLDLHLGPSRIVQPDVFVVRGLVDLTATGPIEQIPVLCVEVLSTNRVYDRVTKRFLYGEAGVPEYWLVDPVTQAVENFFGVGLGGSRSFDGDFPGGLVEGLAQRLRAG